MRLGNRSVNGIVEEIGISSPTIHEWGNKLANIGGMKKLSKPQNRSVQEKFKAVTEYDLLPADGRGEYLRKNAPHEENHSVWRK